MMTSKVRIRMYRQGLGDCFLLSFSPDIQPFHMLIDCGVFYRTPREKEKMRGVVQHILRDTGGKLDVVVATHEHYDHLSGFMHAKDMLETNCKIKQVWLAWTEDPQNEQARDLQKKRQLGIDALHKAAIKLHDTKEAPLQAAATKIDNILQFFGELPAASSDFSAKSKESVAKQALNFLVDFDEAQVKYCYPDQAAFTLENLPGVRFYVLGPPEDKTLIKRSKPSTQHSEVYEMALGVGYGDSFLAAVSTEDGTDGNSAHVRCLPFDSYYQVSLEEARQHEFFRAHYGFEADSGQTPEAGQTPGDKAAKANENAWRRIEHDWLTVAKDLALDLDSNTNNTSLALAIEFIDSGKVLLFPGDAQVGNWLSWEGLVWNIPDGANGTRTITAKDLLSRVVFYKVGHHGSHNATLRQKGLELMTSPHLVAMIPVDQKFAAAAPREWEFPFKALKKALCEKTKGRVILMDEAFPVGAKSKKPEALSDHEWKKFLANTKLTKEIIEGVKVSFFDHFID